MDPSHRAWIAAAVLAAGALVLGWFDQLGAAVALLAGATGILVLVVEGDVEPERPEQVDEGNLESLARLAASLELTGRGLHVPPGPTLDRARLFVPAREADATELPALEEGTIIHRGPPGVLGLSLIPPGRGLTRAWEAMSGLPTGQGREEAAVHLKRSMPALGLGEDVHVSTQEDRVRVEYEHQLLEAACRRTRIELSPWDVQGGCPACSFAATLVAYAYDAPVRTRACQPLEGGRVELEMEVLA